MHFPLPKARGFSSFVPKTWHYKFITCRNTEGGPKIDRNRTSQNNRHNDSSQDQHCLNNTTTTQNLQQFSSLNFTQSLIQTHKPITVTETSCHGCCTSTQIRDSNPTTNTDEHESEDRNRPESNHEVSDTNLREYGRQQQRRRFCSNRFSGSIFSLLDLGLYIDALNVLRVGKDRGEEEETETAKNLRKRLLFSSPAAAPPSKTVGHRAAAPAATPLRRRRR